MSFYYTDTDKFIQRWYNHCSSGFESAMKTDVDSSRAQVCGCVATHAYLIKFQGKIKDKHDETIAVQDTITKYHVIPKS